MSDSGRAIGDERERRYVDENDKRQRRGTKAAQLDPAAGDPFANIRDPEIRKRMQALAAEDALPFPNARFDRVLLVHALEESSQPEALLREMTRVLAPAGRLIAVAAARNGPWAPFESTPFGHGRPFSRRQLAEGLRAAGLEPTGWTRALYVPPLPWLAGWAEGFEQAGSRLWPPLSGLILMEAVKQTLALQPRPERASVRRRTARRGATVGASPQPAGRRPAGA